MIIGEDDVVGFGSQGGEKCLRLPDHVDGGLITCLFQLAGNIGHVLRTVLHMQDRQCLFQRRRGVFETLADIVSSDAGLAELIERSCAGGSVWTWKNAETSSGLPSRSVSNSLLAMQRHPGDCTRESLSRNEQGHSERRVNSSPWVLYMNPARSRRCRAVSARAKVLP